MNVRPAFAQSVFHEAARAALAAIDLDPASTPTANAVVQARQFCSLEMVTIQWRVCVECS